MPWSLPPPIVTDYDDPLGHPPPMPVGELGFPPPSALIGLEPEIQAPPPQAGLPVPALGLPPPVYDEPDLPLPLPEQYRRSAAAVETTAGEIATLEREQADLIGQLAKAPTPEIEKRIAAGAVALEAKRGQQGKDRAKAQEDRAVYEAQVSADARAAEVSSAEAARAEFQAAKTKADARRAQLDSAAQSAEKDLADRKRAYGQTLRAGPKDQQSWGVMLAEMVTEGINATLERRPLNLGKLVDRWHQQNREAFADAVRADEAGLDFAEDALARAANERARLDQELAMQRAAIYEAAAEDLDIRLKRASSELEEAQLLGVRDGVRQAQAQQEALAMASAQEAQLKREEMRAKIAKTQAETAVLRRKAAPGIGGGTVGAAGTGFLPQNVVTLPGTQEVIATAPKDKVGIAAAKKANETLVAFDDFLRQANEYEALLEDYGQRGVFDKTGFAESPQMRTLETARSTLGAAFAKILASGYNPSTVIEEKANEILSPPEGWWQRSGTALAGIREIKRNAEEQLKPSLQNVGGLDAAAVEKYIAFRRARSQSKRDTVTEFRTRAGEIAANPEEKLATREEAVRQVALNAKAEADASGAPEYEVAYRGMRAVYDELKAQPSTPERNKTLRRVLAQLVEIQSTAKKAREDARARIMGASSRGKLKGKTLVSVGEKVNIDEDSLPGSEVVAAIDEIQGEELRTAITEASPRLRKRILGWLRDDQVDGDEAEKLKKLRPAQRKHVMREISKTRRRKKREGDEE